MAGLGMSARLARRAARRALAQLRFAGADNPRIAHMPRLFANSFPKSGTHLLTQVLGGLARLGPVVASGLPAVLTFEGESGVPRPVHSILGELRRLLPGDIGYGHLHAFPEVVAELCRAGTANFFIYRDPRDVVVSHVFYVTDKNARHVHHDHYVNELPDFDARLSTSILGRPEAQHPFPDIGQRFAPYLPWLEQEQVLALRFEDFIAAAPAAGRVLDHATAHGFAYRGSRDAALATLLDAMHPERSPTFRSGTVGSWRQHFKPEHQALFKEVSGGLLEKLGYEKGSDW